MVWLHMQGHAAESPLPGGTEGQEGFTLRGPWTLQPRDEIVIIKKKK